MLKEYVARVVRNGGRERWAVRTKG